MGGKAVSRADARTGCAWPWTVAGNGLLKIVRYTSTSGNDCLTLAPRSGFTRKKSCKLHLKGTDLAGIWLWIAHNKEMAEEVSKGAWPKTKKRGKPL